MSKRQELEKRDGLRFRCRAIVVRFGAKPRFKGSVPTILLRDVLDAHTGKLLTDHLWFTTGRWSAALRTGDIFEFDARVAEYTKNYQGRRKGIDAPGRDWQLQRPTKVTRLGS